MTRFLLWGGALTFCFLLLGCFTPIPVGYIGIFLSDSTGRYDLSRTRSAVVNSRGDTCSYSREGSDTSRYYYARCEDDRFLSDSVEMILFLDLDSVVVPFPLGWGDASKYAVEYQADIINDLEDSRLHDWDYYDLSPYLGKQGDRLAYKRE